MATEILKSFSHLQSELEEAKSSLKGVDENIKRLIGRDPSDLPPRPILKRPLDDRNARLPFMKFSRTVVNDEVSKRRNPNTVSVFKRLSDKVSEGPLKPSRGLISKVIAAPREVPSRQSVLDKQNRDEKFKARNRRMFGALLGTLQRFQQDECKLKKKEEKRTQIEKKIEEHEQQEKEEIKKERQELFLNRKKKQNEIKMIELKMLRMKEYAAWEQTQKPRTNFIVTKAKPPIHYLPRKMDDKSKELLQNSQKEVEEQIEKRRQAVYDELNHIEDRMKRNFDFKNHIESKEEEKPNDRHNRHHSDSEDEDGDVKMKSLSPEPRPEEEESELKEPEEEENSNTEELHHTEELQNVPMENGSQISQEQNDSNYDSQQNIYVDLNSEPMVSTDLPVENINIVYSETTEISIVGNVVIPVNNQGISSEPINKQEEI